MAPADLPDGLPAQIPAVTLPVADSNGPLSESHEPAVEVTAMQFAYAGDAPVVTNFSLKLPRGSRCLLVGANGAGTAVTYPRTNFSPQLD